MNQYQNQMNYNNNTYQANQIKGMYYQINNNHQNFTNFNNNIYSYDKRLVLSLKYLGLSKYISNFIKKGTRFEDFLSFSNSDLTSLKIPHNIQDIIQKFILAYLNFGSLYTIEEINLFFKTQKVKKYFPKKNKELNINDMNRGKVKYKSVNQKNNNNINIKYNQNMNLNNYDINLINSSKNQNNNKRPKSQTNKLMGVPNNFIQDKIQNNLKQKILTNNNNNYY